ncbi:MAG: hypothetical protein R3C99_24980 [Pirellulaceae bacterium]
MVHEPFDADGRSAYRQPWSRHMEIVGNRRGTLDEMQTRAIYHRAFHDSGLRGLIGIRTRMLNATQGTAVIHHRFQGYKPWAKATCRAPTV